MTMRVAVIGVGPMGQGHAKHYRDQLPHFNLEHASVQERVFLAQIGFNTNVRRGQYAKYYYALEV